MFKWNKWLNKSQFVLSYSLLNKKYKLMINLHESKHKNSIPMERKHLRMKK